MTSIAQESVVTPTLTLRERAAQAAQQHTDAERRRDEEVAQQRRVAAVRFLLKELETIGVQNVDDNGIRPEYVGYSVEGAYAEADGITFGISHGRYPGATKQLAVKVECVRGCGKPLFVLVGYPKLVSLNGILTAKDHDHGTCLVQYDEDGERTTDEWGKPLPAREPPKPQGVVEGERRAEGDGILADVIARIARRVVLEELDARGVTAL